MINNSKGRGGGPRLSITKKLEIIEKFQRDNPPTKISLAREYNVTEKSIRYILSHSEEIKKKSTNIHNARRKTTYNTFQPKYPELEETLLKWIETDCCKIEPAPSIIIEKAKQIAATMGESYVSFRASWGWYQKFKIRSGLEPLPLEEVDSPEVIVPTVSSLDKFYDTIMQYDPENIFSMSETGLFNRLLPRYSALFPDEDVSIASGMRKMYNRVSLVVCCNSTGMDRLPITMISKSKIPSCIKGKQWPIPYYQQDYALMDRKTFEKWFDDVFHAHILQKTKENVLLILDNKYVYQQEFEKGNIRVIFLPIDITCIKQPMNMGIITAFKNKYKCLLMKDIVYYHNSPDEVKEQQDVEKIKMVKAAIGVEFGKPAHLLDTARNCLAAWSDLPSDFLKNSFQRANIITQFRPSVPSELRTELQEFDQDDSQLISEIYDLFQSCYLPNPVYHDKSAVLSEIKEFLHLDDKDSDFFHKCVKEDIDNTLGNEN